MKDYYYILGVSLEASELEIKTAYKKLSVKFHPDKNEGDQFFEDRFKEVQEAYETLSNPLKRANYNAALDPRKAREYLDSIDTNPPLCTVFDISKKSIREGDPITIRWNTVHANEVEIDFLGKVAASGTKTIRLPMIYNKEKIVIKLQAKNTFVDQEVVKKIIVKNKSFKERQIQLLYDANAGDREEAEEKETLLESEPLEENSTPSGSAPKEHQSSIKKEKVKRPPTKEERLNGIKQIVAEDESQEEAGFKMSDMFVYVVLVLLLIFITIMTIFVYKMNPF